MAKGGNPNVTLRSDFVRVVFVDPLEVQEENATADNITSHHSGVNREALQLNTVFQHHNFLRDLLFDKPVSVIEAESIIIRYRTSTITTELPPTIATTPAPSPPALPVASCVVPSRVSVHVMYSRSDPGGGAGDRGSNREKSPIYRVNGVR